MTAQPDTRPDIDMDAAELGFKDAARITAAMYAGGMPLDQIDAHHADVAARLLSDAQTGPGRDYASAYDDTARSLVRDLQADADAARGAPIAANMPDGTPHPDAFLADRGWHVDGGVYVRSQPQAPAADVDRWHAGGKVQTSAELAALIQADREPAAIADREAA